MKKSLLSLLAILLAVVGCQNYDDQFDDLNSQIAALSSQVAGLAQVQSDLASLAGTVSSLQSTVASTATAIEGLDGLAENVAAIQESVNDVASSEEVADIASDLDAAQEDLDDLLASASVFTNDVVVNSVATLDVYHKMGNSLNVVAANVDITAKSDMDATKLQELVNSIYTTTGYYSYKADQSSVAPVTFDNLTGTQTLTVDQAGDYSFKTLNSATVINLMDSYKSKVTKIDFRELTSVTKFQTNGTDNTISFSKAMELHLTKLVYYPPLDLTILVDEGAAMPFVMDDVDASGDQSNLSLDITGPASFSVSNISDGSISVTDVKDVTINGFEGAITILKGVETFAADKVVTMTLSGTLDLETMDFTGAVDPDVTTSVGPAISLASISSLETVDIDGVLSSLSVTSCGNVTAITLAADVAGKVDIDGNTDLVTIAVTGAKATELDVNANTDLESLTVDLTWRAGTATGAVIDGVLTVTGNTSLETLAVSSDNLENTIITGNDDLTSIDFNGLTSGGATGSPDIEITNNDLEATLVDKDDTASTSTGDGEANDLGSVSNSGLKNASTYLTSLAADADSKIVILYDTVDFTNESDASTEATFAVGTANASQDTKLRLAYIVPNTADTGSSEVAAKRGYVITGYGDSGDMVDVFANGVLIVQRPDMSSANTAQVVANMTTTAALTNAGIAGVTYSVTQYAKPEIWLTIDKNSSSMENSASVVSNLVDGFATAASDVFSIALNGANTATVSGTAVSDYDPSALSDQLYNEWVAKNVTASATWSKWDISSSETGTVTTIKFTAKDSGTSQIGEGLTFTTTIDSATMTSIGYTIGNAVPGQNTNDAGDNVARGNGIVVSFLAATGGTNRGEIGSPWISNTAGVNNVTITVTGVTVHELSTTLNRSIADSGTITDVNTYPNDSRSDVITPQAIIGATASNASSFSRITWL